MRESVTFHTSIKSPGEAAQTAIKIVAVPLDDVNIEKFQRCARAVEARVGQSIVAACASRCAVVKWAFGDVPSSNGIFMCCCRAEEIMTPIIAFQTAGAVVSVYSTAGGEIPIAEASLNEPFRTEDVDTFLADGMS